jgi:glycosyltransferase involved in cell wall biosynthesis
MNIVLISSLLIPKSTGGVEVLTVLLASALAQRGHSVTILTGGEAGRRRMGKVEIVELPELVFPRRLKGFLMPILTRRLRARLGRHPAIAAADIVNAVDLDSILAIAGWERLSGRFVPTIQDYGLVCANGLLLYGRHVCPNYCHHAKGFACIGKRRIGPLHRLYLRLAYAVRKSYRDRQLRQLTDVICVSRFVADRITDIAPHIRTTIIGNCLPAEWTARSPQPSARTERDVDITYAGRLEPFKGVDVFLEALRHLKTRQPLTVRFVGGGRTGEYRKRLSALGLRHRIEIARTVPFEHMDDAYARSKIVVVPSVWPEPCGRVIIEGMFHGCAVISTAQGGTPELIDNSRNGLLVTPGDPTALSQAIDALLSDGALRRSIGTNAHRKAAASYTQDIIATRYETEYGRIIRKAGAPRIGSPRLTCTRDQGVLA